MKRGGRTAKQVSRKVEYRKVQHRPHTAKCGPQVGLFMLKQRLTLATAVLAVAALGTAFAPVMPAAAQTTPAARSVGVARLTILVSDIDKSVDFYQRVGLIKASDMPSTDADQGGVFGAADLPLTADSKRGRLVIMQNGDGKGSLALLSYDKPPLPSARGNLVGLGLGDVIVGVEVPDIQVAYGRLGQIGTRFQRTVVRFSQPDSNGAMQNGQHFLAYDPDGHMVEVSQMDRR